LRDRIQAFGAEIVSTRISRQVVLLDLEYLIYSARSERRDREARKAFDEELRQLAERFRAVNDANGERVPIPEDRDRQTS